MLCPNCKTENRDERATCYHCEQDLSTLRLVVNQAKSHYNDGLEHAERDRTDEAIQEMKRALAADSSFVPAWVVLGTLYAREERFEEANEAWHRALSINPQLEKCHEYLRKSESVVRSLPALRRLRFIALASIVAAILLAGVLIFALRPDLGSNRIQQALELQERGEVGKAMTLLAGVSDQVLSSEDSRRVAVAFVAQLEADLERRLEQITSFVGAGDYERAVQSISSLNELNLPSDFQDRVTALRQDLFETVIADAEEAIDRFRSERISFDELETCFDDALIVVVDASQRGRLSRLLAGAREEHEATLIALWKTEILESASPSEAAQKTDDFAMSYPALAEVLEGLLAIRLYVDAERSIEAFENALSDGKIAPAHDALLAFTSLYTSIGRDPPDALVRPLASKLAAAERAHLIADIRFAFDRASWEEVIDLTETADESEWTESDLAEIRTMRTASLAGFATSFYAWSEELDREFEDRRIGPDEARRMIEKYELALLHLSDDYFKQRILYYAALAYSKLSDVARARALINRLESEYPKSRILKWRAYKQFKTVLDRRQTRPSIPSPDL